MTIPWQPTQQQDTPTNVDGRTLAAADRADVKNHTDSEEAAAGEQQYQALLNGYTQALRDWETVGPTGPESKVSGDLEGQTLKFGTGDPDWTFDTGIAFSNKKLLANISCSGTPANRMSSIG